jgi:hypothetical protein
MKALLTILTTLITLASFSQIDGNGNPVVNSIEMGVDSLNGCQLLANYYTLQNNIDNKGSSVYIADKPTLDQIAKAATNLPADFFILSKNGSILKMILVNTYPAKWFLVVTPGQAGPKKYKNPLNGDIAENRANELIKAGYDSASKIADGKLRFNDKRYNITSNAEIKDAVMRLISEEHLADTSGITMPSKEELHASILKETRPGGELDYFTPIKGREMQGVQIKPGLIDTRIGIALYKWGKANKDLGVATLDEAYSIFAEFKGRDLDIREKGYIKLGFEKGLEK